jgi:hypothetical protein
LRTTQVRGCSRIWGLGKGCGSWKGSTTLKAANKMAISMPIGQGDRFDGMLGTFGERP